MIHVRHTPCRPCQFQLTIIRKQLVSFISALPGAAELSTSGKRGGCDLTGVRPKAADAAISHSAACALLGEGGEVLMIPVMEQREEYWMMKWSSCDVTS